MPDDLKDLLHHNLAFLLEETFASPPPTSGNAYLDTATGWGPTLASLSAEEASQALLHGGTTIAGHVEHARFYLEVLLRYAAGRGERVDWADSWQVHEVTPVAWEALKETFLDTCLRAHDTLLERDSWDDHALGAALAILAHSAYHLGAVRQRALAVRSG